jgi:hypothetical protein
MAVTILKPYSLTPPSSVQWKRPRGLFAHGKVIRFLATTRAKHPKQSANPTEDSVDGSAVLTVSKFRPLATETYGPQPQSIAVATH